MDNKIIVQNSNNKILFILHLPPPIHGAALMGQYLRESAIIHASYECKFLNLSFSYTLGEIGKVSLKKIIHFTKLLVISCKMILIFRPDLCYFTINASGIPFYRDMIYITLFKLFRIKLVYHFHNKGISLRQEFLFDNILYKLAFNNSYCILLSTLVYSDISKYVPMHKVAFCANGIPDCIIKRKGKEKNEFVHLLFLSNMMSEKGVYDLLEACRILKRRGSKFKCHFVGQWSNVTEKDLNTKVKELDIRENVLSYGGQYGKKKDEFFEIADIFVFPTYYHREAFSLVVLEAMQHSLPVISTGEGAISEMVVDGETGFIIEKRNPLELALKVEFLIQHPKERISLGKAGRLRYERKYSIKIWENNLKNILDQIINES
jgi:glycosyltransferase involved in cell wall biosynthesis